MFGTIARATMKPGSEAALRALDDEWMATLRPKIPGEVLYIRATAKDDPTKSIAVFLCQDEGTYWKLADDPEQDAFFARVSENFVGETTWEDISADLVIHG